MVKEPGKYKSVLFLLILILIPPALFINLGKLPLIADEATRALVALEMKLSGNLLTPTIQGEFYFNKPPLYNWILLAFFQSGNYSELIIRLPAVISLVLYTLTIYLFTKHHSDKRTAFICAMAFLTIGRILFYDSMLGLIDLTFSWVIFLNFILIFYFIRKDKFYPLFLISYFITALAFLLKGLPSLVFQGITLITAFVYFKRIKKLLTRSHIIGILIFLFVVGGYYFMVWKENPTSNYLNTLVTESTKRTFIEYGWGKTLLHLFTFPFEQFYHLIPWSVFFIFLFSKNFYRHIQNNVLLSYFSLVFMTNIIIYWISVETYPRYLFMLYPLLLVVLIHYYQNIPSRNVFKKTSEKILLFTAILLIPAGLLTYFLYPFELNRSLFHHMVMGSLVISVFTFVILYTRMPAFRPEFLIILLLILRIGFNLIVAPERYASSRRVIQKKQAVELGRLTKDKELYLDPESPLSIESTYYITRERKKIIPLQKPESKKGALYIIDNRAPVKENEEVIYVFEIRYESLKVRVSKFDAE